MQLWVGPGVFLGTIHRNVSVGSDLHFKPIGAIQGPAETCCFFGWFCSGLVLTSWSPGCRDRAASLVRGACGPVMPPPHPVALQVTRCFGEASPKPAPAPATAPTPPRPGRRGFPSRPWGHLPHVPTHVCMAFHGFQDGAVPSVACGAPAPVPACMSWERPPRAPRLPGYQRQPHSGNRTLFQDGLPGVLAGSARQGGQWTCPCCDPVTKCSCHHVPRGSHPHGQRADVTSTQRACSL